MRDILRKARPQRLDDLIALNALYRPGPLRSGMVDDFIARKGGKTEIKYELPQLEPILSDTYGVIAYQEQVMRIAATLASFSLGQSDVLRKAMGKKNPAVMQAQREKFVKGAVGNGLNEKKAGKIFDLMEHFAGYGFNKSHSTTYAFLAYQTGVSEGQLPVALPGGAAHDRSAEHRQGRDLPWRVPRSRRAGAAARHQRERTALHRDARRRALRPDGDQERRRGRHRVDSRRAQGAGRDDPVAAPVVRGARSAPRQQARLRGAGQGWRAGFAGASARCRHRAGAACA